MASVPLATVKPTPPAPTKSGLVIRRPKVVSFASLTAGGPRICVDASAMRGMNVPLAATSRSTVRCSNEKANAPSITSNARSCTAPETRSMSPERSSPVPPTVSVSTPASPKRVSRFKLSAWAQSIAVALTAAPEPGPSAS